VIREGHVVVPKEDTVFAAGDEVLVLTSESSESQVRGLLVGQPEPGEGDDEGQGEGEPAEEAGYSRS
jgi:TrkA-C domain